MKASEIIALTSFDLCPYCTRTKLAEHCNNEGCKWLRCQTCNLNYDTNKGRVNSGR